MSLRAGVSALCLAVSLLAGCEQATQAPAASTAQALAADQAQFLTQRYEAAKASGQTQATLYIAGPPDEWRPLWQAFNEEYPGIRITVLPLVGPSLANRLSSERVSGQHQGDLVLSLYQDILPLAELGFFVDDSPITSASLAASWQDPKGRYQFLFSKRHTLVYNTHKLKAEEVPKNLEQVLNERWRGRFGYYTPSAFSVSDEGLAGIEHQRGLSDSELQRLHDLGKYGFAPDELITQVSQGRLDFALWAIASVAIDQADAGAPVALAPVADATIDTPFGLALVAEAPHPDAARLLKAWLFTPRAQQLLASRLHYQGLMPGAPAPDGIADSEAPITPLPPDAQGLKALASLHERTRTIWKE